MKVTLIDYQENAADLLIFTKNTRLEMKSTGLADIADWPHEKKMEELAYMANTIPSSWEFVSYTFMVEGVSRAFTHQAVRTRAASYAQQSMRVTDQGDYQFVMPAAMVGSDHEYAQGLIDATNQFIRKTYSELSTAGYAAEDARSILPTNIATNICARYNLRTFSELAKSRSGGRTQGEYQEVVQAMIDEVLKVHPWADKFLFGDVGRDYFAEIEAFAKDKFPDLMERGALLKIVDKMRKSR